MRCAILTSVPADRLERFLVTWCAVLSLGLAID
jgi:hypothetical protein